MTLSFSDRTERTTIACPWKKSRNASVRRGLEHFSPFSTNFRRGSPSVLLTPLLPAPDTGASMARYSSFLGRPAELHYRAGHRLLPHSRTFVADSDGSIFL